MDEFVKILVEDEANKTKKSNGETQLMNFKGMTEKE